MNKVNIVSRNLSDLQIRERGGQCVSVRVDHEKEDEIEALFQQINREQDGRLDILVNNAYKGVEVCFP